MARKLLNGDNFRRSENDYDWLGHGIYFWESNPRRGLDFAKELKKRGKAIGTPALVGAVIDLGFCLDLTTLSGLDQVKTAYDSFSQITSEAGVPMPENVGGSDLLLRKLDCAVLNTLHQLRSESDERPFDTVKGVFVEGDRLYEGAGLFEPCLSG